MISADTVKMSPAFKRRATKAWVTRFSELRVVKTMQIGRIVGPFFQGITLDRDSGNDGYYPTAHIHNLATDISAITLGMPTRLKKPPHWTDDKISIELHNTDLEDIIAMLRRQMPLPMEGNLTAAQLIAAYEGYVRSNWPRGLQIAHLKDFLTANIWIGDACRIGACRAYCDSIVAGWSSAILRQLERYGDMERYQSIHDCTHSDLQLRVERSIDRFGLQSLNRAEFLP